MICLEGAINRHLKGGFCKNCAAKGFLHPKSNIIFDDEAIMRTARNLNPIPEIPKDDGSEELRRPGRIKCDYLFCRHGKKKFGQVTDLSRNGMRIVRKGFYQIPKGSKTELLLCWQQAQVPVMCRVAWERKIGMFTYLMGLEFLDVTPDLASVIQSLAVKARTSLIIASIE